MTTLPALPMCNCCPDPGRCCRRLHLSVPGDEKSSSLAFWKRTGTSLHALVEMARRFLPFVPIEPFEYVVEGPEGGEARTWWYSCPELRVDGRCAIYEDRPQVCRDFRPGSSPLCVYHVGGGT